MCVGVCVLQTLEGRVGKVHRKFISSQGNAFPGFGEDEKMNIFLVFLPQISVVQPCLEYLMPKIAGFFTLPFFSQGCVSVFSGL